MPSLTSVRVRLRPEWITAFLISPHDLRGLDASMPRLAIREDEARDIAAFLTSDGTAPSDDGGGDAARGRRLLETRGCGSCHVFTGVAPIPASPLPTAISADGMRRAASMAPDLRETRERFRRPSLIGWLVDPLSMKPDTLMPRMDLSRAEAEDIAAYLYETPLEDRARIAIPPLPAPLDREVTWDEVYERVFGRTCRHCHADPDYALGDGGPGNTGGFGFAPRRLNLATYEGASSGAMFDGERRSIFAVQAGAPPHVVRALMARHAEVAGQPVAGVRGMPLGLPPVPIDDIQLVVTWIARGRPR